MAFVPIIDFCLEKSNGEYQLVPKDITNVYNASSNPTGWEDASTLLAANVTAATLVVTDPNNTSYTVDVLSQIPDPVTGEIEFTAITDDNIAIIDGLYKIVYTVTAGDTSYEVCKQKYFYPNIKCCISKFVKRVALDPTNKKYQEELVQVKAYEYTLEYAAKTLDQTTANAMIALLQKYCNYNNCNC